jgi:hypothetical protein
VTAGLASALSATAAAANEVVRIPAFRRSFSFPGPLLTSQRSSTGIEHLETVAQQAFDTLMKPSMRIAAAGLLCLLGPPALLLSVPIVLLLLPLLFPLGLILTAIGLTRAGIVASFDGSRVWASSPRESRVPRHSSSPATPTGMHLRGQRSTRHHARPESRDCTRAPVASGSAGSREGMKGGADARGSPDARAAAVEPTLRVLRKAEQRVATIDGSLSTLNSLTTQRGERLVRQVGTLVRHNVARATSDIRAEVEVQLQALQRELQSWVGANPNLKPYCHGRIGWLLRRDPPGAPDVTDLFLQRYLGERTPGQPAPSLSAADAAAMPMPDGMKMSELEYLLVPGLLTKWYPLYMAQLRADFKRLGLRATFSRIDTDQPVRVNAARLRHEVGEARNAGGGGGVVGLEEKSRGRPSRGARGECTRFASGRRAHTPVCSDADGGQGHSPCARACLSWVAGSPGLDLASWNLGATPVCAVWAFSSPSFFRLTAPQATSRPPTPSPLCRCSPAAAPSFTHFSPLRPVRFWSWLKALPLASSFSDTQRRASQHPK